MMKIVKRWLIIAFLLLTVALLAWFKLTQPRILVVQSYGTDYTWARDIDAGIKRVLHGNLRYKIEWHYMDTKNHPDAAYKHRAGLLAAREIEHFRPDLIIAVDDDAQQYAVKDYANHPNVNIVFAGINGTVAPYGYDRAANVTGIYERKPLRSLVNALSDLRHTDGSVLGRRIVHIGDDSRSVIEDSKEIESMDWAPFRLVRSVRAGTFEEWKEAVADAGKQGDVILVSNYHAILREKGGKEVVPPAQIVEWTEQNSAVPVVGIGGYLVEDGGMLAIGASGFEQGDVIARMAEDILDRNIRPADIPQVMPRQYLVYMRQSEMEKRRLVLPNIYEAFSRASDNYY